MFDFIKKLFEKETTPIIEEIKNEELEKWFYDRLSQIEFKEEIIEFSKKIRDLKLVLEEKIKFLEESQISEQDKNKVEEKIKNIVIGHKNNYIREIKNFLNNLDISNKKDLQEAIVFNKKLNKQLDELAKRTAKSYQASQHLFFEPVEIVFKVMGEINSLVRDFNKKIKNKNFERIKEMEEKISLRREMLNKKERLKKEISWKEEKINRCLEGKNKQEKEIAQLKNSEDYLELKNLKNKKNELDDYIKNNRDEIFIFFSRLGRALRKYEKISLEQKTIKKYLENSVETFLDDKKLKIIDILKTLESCIKKNEIDLDDKNKEVVFSSIKKIEDNYLKNLMEKENKIRKEIKKTETELMNITLDKSIEEAKYKLEHFEEQFVLSKRLLNEFNIKLKSLDTKKLDEESKDLIKDLFDIELKII